MSKHAELENLLGAAVGESYFPLSYSWLPDPRAAGTAAGLSAASDRLPMRPSDG